MSTSKPVFKAFLPGRSVSSAICLFLCIASSNGHAQPDLADRAPPSGSHGCAAGFSPAGPIPSKGEPAFRKFIETTDYTDLVNESIYRIDVNNDRTDDWVLEYTAGSSSVLYIHVFEMNKGQWIEIGFPLETWHGWGNQLFGTFCGDLIINLSGGTWGSNYRESFIWNADGSAVPYCRPEWIEEQMALANDFAELSQFASAHGQLDWIDDACGKHMSEEQAASVSEARSGVSLKEALAASADHSWTRSYIGKWNYELVRDSRFEPSIVAITNSRVFRDYLIANLGGPGEAVASMSDRYISFGACRPHSCGDNGFVWLDLETGKGIAAIVRYGTGQTNGNSKPTECLAVVDSRHYGSDNLPDEFVQSLRQSCDRDNVRIVIHDSVTSLYDDHYWPNR